MYILCMYIAYAYFKKNTSANLATLDILHLSYPNLLIPYLASIFTESHPLTGWHCLAFFFAFP